MVTMEIISERERHEIWHGSLSSRELNLSVIAPKRHIEESVSSEDSDSEDSEECVIVSEISPMSLGHRPMAPHQLALDKEKCHYCQLERFPSHVVYPVTIANEADDEEIPSTFKFIPETIFTDGIEPAEASFRSGCGCERDLDCEYSVCSCLDDVEEIESTNGSRRKKSYAYLSMGPNKGCLRKEILESRNPIYECQELCNCSKACNNRVTERGRSIPLEIFRTSNGRGWGLRSTVPIQTGQFIDKYVGEVITATHALRRRDASHEAKHKEVYLFALDKFSDPESMDSRLACDPYEIDGEFMGGPTRFINHSCDPNLRIFARVGDHADKHLHDLAFFAARRIDPGEELTFDYTDGVDGADADLVEASLDPSKQGDLQKCLCGSYNCRGFLW